MGVSPKHVKVGTRLHLQVQNGDSWEGVIIRKYDFGVDIAWTSERIGRIPSSIYHSFEDVVEDKRMKLLSLPTLKTFEDFL